MAPGGPVAAYRLRERGASREAAVEHRIVPAGVGVAQAAAFSAAVESLVRSEMMRAPSPRTRTAQGTAPVCTPRPLRTWAWG